jgi:vacuolar-type H+-ATPase subunit H
MDKVLKALKEAEIAADGIEAEGKEKAAELVKAAEVESRKIEVDLSSKAKAVGEAMLSKKMAEAKEQASKIIMEGRERAAEAEAKAKKNFDACVDVVVKATASSMGSTEEE